MQVLFVGVDEESRKELVREMQGTLSGTIADDDGSGKEMDTCDCMLDGRDVLIDMHGHGGEAVHVRCVKNEFEAFSCLEAGKYDLLFLEASDTASIVGLVEKTRGLQKNCHVIFISAFQDFDLAVAGMKSGVEGYLVKPVRREEIRALLLKIMDEMEREKVNEKNRVMVEEYEKYQVIKHIIQKKLTNPKAIRSFLSFQCDMGDIRALIGCVMRDDIVGYSLDTEDELRDICRQNIEKYLAGYKYFIFLMGGTEAFLLINVADSALLMYHLQVRLIRMLEAINRASVRGSVSAGVGRMGYLKDIPKIYGEAEKALEYKYCYGTGRCLDYKTCVESEEQRQGFSGENLNKRIQAIMETGDEKELEKEIDRCKRELFGIRKERVQEILLRNLVLVANGNEGFRQSILEIDRFEEAILCWGEILFDVLRGKKEKQAYGVLVGRGISYIREHYREQFTVEELSRYLGISAGHFSRIFKSETGMNFVKYVNQYRVDKAEELIRETDYKLYEVAEKTGFLDYGYFTRTFRKIKGISPSEIRKANSFGGMD